MNMIVGRHACFAGAAAVCMVAAAPAAAQTRSFDIAAQSATTGVAALARQANIQIFAARRDTRGKRTNAVRGDMNVTQALEALLRGTGLTARRTGPQAFTIVTDPSAGPGEPDQMLAGESQSDGPAPDEASDRNIVVTGSRIRGQQSASPTHVLDREDFAQSGASSVQQALRTMPQNFTGGSSETASAVTSTRNGNENNIGLGAGVNLRGLGTESTLVLLNGRRLAPGGFGNLTDVSTIPLSAIERIEVVPDGASAIYGSDAVGGVVNMVLRSDYDGFETRLRYGTVTDGSLRQYGVSQLAGTQWESGAILLNLDYGENEPLFASERPFATGLQTGVTYLSPSDERYSFLVNGHQELTGNLRLSGVAYGTSREATGRNFIITQGRQNRFAGKTEQIGGTLELEWRPGDDWALTLAHTHSYDRIERRNFLGATATVPASETFVFATHNVSATELEAEGALVTLPGGEARLALGVERRLEDLRVHRFTGNVTSNYDREVLAGYAELFVPLIGEPNAGPFARRLSFSLATRYEDYDDVGDADTYKVGAIWSPVEGLNFRGTWGTSFRAPYLYQYDANLSTGLIIDLPNAASPTGLTRTAVLVQLPDSNLGPERATSWTAGFDLEPSRLGLRVSATYFDIRYEDRISAARFEFGAFANPALRSLISMPPDPELIAALASVVQFGNFTNGGIETVEATFDGRTRNQAATDVTGIDFSLDKRFDTGFGEINAGINLSRLLSFDLQPIAGVPPADILDTIYNPVDLRVRGSLTWQSGGWSASAFVNYTDDYVDNQVPTAPVPVDSWTTVDLGLGYAFGPNRGVLSGLTLRANVVNAFDQDPPRIIDRGASFGNPGYDTENANPIGRIVAFELTKAW